jgi:hypothetical protein
MGKPMISFVNSRANATSKRQHLWEIASRFAPAAAVAVDAFNALAHLSSVDVAHRAVSVAPDCSLRIRLEKFEDFG